MHQIWPMEDSLSGIALVEVCPKDMEKRHVFKFVYLKKLKKFSENLYVLFSINYKITWLLEEERRWKIKQNAS